MVRGKTNNKAANGKRYTVSERKKIVQYVIKVNRDKGRGGVSAAARRFGVSPSSIGKWIGEEGGVIPSSNGFSRKSAQTGRVLAQLIDLRESIDALERELALKLARFNELKRKV